MMDRLPEPIAEIHVIKVTRKVLQGMVEKFKYEKLSFNNLPGISFPSHKSFMRSCIHASYKPKKHKRL